MTRRGFSLVEALFTALLVSLALGVVAAIAHQFQRAMARASASDSGLQAMLEIHKVAEELQEATAIQSPALANNSALLQFQRINPAYPGRLPATLVPAPSPVPAAWEPRDPAYLVSVSFFMNAVGQLVRRVDFAGGVFEQQVCADSILHFQAQHANRGALNLTATVSQAERTRTISMVVNLQAVGTELTP